jgi:hypothetical protein
MFLYREFWMLLVQIFVLYSWAGIAERLVGPVGYVLAVLSAGMVGEIANAYGNTGQIFDAGGGLAPFALTLGFVARQRHALPLKAAKVSILWILLYWVGLAAEGYEFGFVWSVVEVTAGIGCGWMLSQPVTLWMRREQRARNIRLGILAGAVFAISFLVAPGYSDSIGAQDELDKMFAVQSQIAEAHRKGENARCADLVNLELVPQLRRALLQLQANEGFPERFQDYFAAAKRYVQITLDSSSELARAYAVGDFSRVGDLWTQINLVQSEFQQASDRARTGNESWISRLFRSSSDGEQPRSAP